MSRLLVPLIALCVLGYLAYRQLYGQAPTASSVASPKPVETLHDAREAAKRIEHDQDKRTEEAQKAADQER